MICPDCKLEWGSGPRCQTCGLDVEDLEAAAAFFDAKSDLRYCEYPECSVYLPKDHMVQVPSGGWYCQAHAKEVVA